jgi:hypothetical protein
LGVCRKKANGQRNEKKIFNHSNLTHSFMVKNSICFTPAPGGEIQKIVGGAVNPDSVAGSDADGLESALQI